MKHSSDKGLFDLTVKAVLVNDEGKVLVLKRPKTAKHNPGKYDLVGGTVMPGEKIEAALMREAKEETGLEIEVGPTLNIVDFQDDKGETFGKGIRYLAHCTSSEIKLNDDEHVESAWLTVDEAIGKFENKGYEQDKHEALVRAKHYLELMDSLDGWKRCLADFENYKRRQNESQAEYRQFAKEDVIMQIIPVIDNFHASTDHVPDDQKDNAWVTGIMYIQKQLEQVLKDNGAEEITVKVGDEFNPEIHEAVSHEARNIEHEAKESKNRVVKVIQRGYKLGNKVIRAAKVAVD